MVNGAYKDKDEKLKKMCKSKIETKKIEIIEQMNEDCAKIQRACIACVQNNSLDTWNIGIKFIRICSPISPKIIVILDSIPPP